MTSNHAHGEVNSRVLVRDVLPRHRTAFIAMTSLDASQHSPHHSRSLESEVLQHHFGRIPHESIDVIMTVNTSPPTRPAVPREPRKTSVGRVAFYSHLWFGVLFTVVLTVISITGILLNHKRGLGLMPDVPHSPTAPLAQSISIDSLARLSLVAAAGMPGLLESAGSDDPTRAIDRMDVRPRNGFVKIRLRDRASTEFTLDLATGTVLHVGRRGDAFLERLHSGEAFGSRWVLLSDAGAIGLLVTLVSGYWLWLAPKWRSSKRDAADVGAIDPRSPVPSAGDA